VKLKNIFTEQRLSMLKVIILTLPINVNFAAWENPNYKRENMSTFGSNKKIGDRVTGAGKSERSKENQI
jgi:hypothetical protein